MKWQAPARPTTREEPRPPRPQRLQGPWCTNAPEPRTFAAPWMRGEGRVTKRKAGGPNRCDDNRVTKVAEPTPKHRARAPTL